MEGIGDNAKIRIGYLLGKGKYEMHTTSLLGDLN